MPYYRGDGDRMYMRGDYYQGDYYQGDYYQGDPFSLGGLIKGAAGFIGKSLIPSPIQSVFDVGRRLIGGGRPTLPPGLPLPYGGDIKRPGQVLVGGGQAGVPARPFIDVIPRGRHMNKSTYVTRGGGTSHWPMQLLVHPPHTETVSNRHMNYGNGRALRRALRRARGFARLARSAGVIMHTYRKKTTKRKR